MKADAETVLGVPRRIAVWVIVLMALGSIACVALWGTTPRETPDTLSYQYGVFELRDALVEPSLDLLPYRTLGYPAILALTGSQDHLTSALFFVQLLSHLATTWIILALARRFALPSPALLALALVLLSPPMMQRVTVGGTEASCELLVTLTALFLVRWTERGKRSDALLAGSSIAAAAFVRPTYQLFGVLMAVAVLGWLSRKGSRRRAVRSSGLLVAGSVVLIGGMIVLNAARFGYVGFSPLLGWNLSTKTAGFVEHLPDDEPAKPILLQARNEALAENPKGMAQMYVWPVMRDLQEELHMDRAEISNHMLMLNLRLIALHPGQYLASVATASASYILPSTGGEVADYGPSTTRDFPPAFLVAHFGFVLAFFVQLVGVTGLFLARRIGASVKGPFSVRAAISTWCISLSLVVYTAMVSVTTDVGYPRVRIPTDPLILLLTFGGIYMIAAALRSRSKAQTSSP